MSKTIAMLLIIALVVMPVSMTNADDSPCMQKCLPTCRQQLPKAPSEQCQIACDKYCHGGEGDEDIAAADSVGHAHDFEKYIGPDGIVRN
ncbi:hypothetical protein Dsin_004346 [Dipteronia sinensis]|uniref:Plant thionin family protein n=1 Tax=Dipteronia sinensis TaxID=43782 RepID=A0AAE0EMZ7_9ROSI|nr:hypothetical protein Dsin_004346 [Dipteronia sinensis]